MPKIKKSYTMHVVVKLSHSLTMNAVNLNL